MVLFPDDDQQQAVMAEFKRRFDDFERPDQGAIAVQDAFAWLATRYSGRPTQPVVFITHPLRKPSGTKALMSLVRQWATTTGLLVM